MKMNNVKIFASIIEDEAKEQIKNLSNSEAYKDCIIRVMPDVHAGKGCTIGTVIETKNRIVPNTVGVDIGCGMLVVNLGKIDIDLEKLDSVINTYIPSGFNVRETQDIHFDFVNPWTHACGSLSDHHARSIGTLGGGNHFIEVDVDDEGNKYLVIHSGSRNLGVRVCEYWQNVAISKLVNKKEIINDLIKSLKEQGREKEIQTELKKLQFPKINEDLAYLEGEDLTKYLEDMEIYQKIARINREAMFEIIAGNMGWRKNKNFCEQIECFETIHNYIDIESKIIRKGAISAKKGEKVIIPMNMRDGSLICIGKGNKDWLCSAPHGAGRIMSRAKAKETLKLEDFKESMNGIYTTTANTSTIDEAPMAYKPYEQIIEDIKDTVEIIKVIKPIYNFKANE